MQMDGMCGYREKAFAELVSRLSWCRGARFAEFSCVRDERPSKFFVFLIKYIANQKSVKLDDAVSRHKEGERRCQGCVRT